MRALRRRHGYASAHSLSFAQHYVHDHGDVVGAAAGAAVGAMVGGGVASAVGATVGALGGAAAAVALRRAHGRRAA